MKKNPSMLLNYELNKISQKESLKQALKRLDKVLIKVLFVMEEETFVATLTDGDVRRAILAGASLDTPIAQVANYAPLYLKHDDKEKVQKYLVEITALPVVDEKNKILKVYIKDAETLQEKYEILDVPVVIMAGGLGTRLYPYTKILPKALIPIIDVPISERIIQSFQKIGCKRFHMVVNHKKNMIKAYFNELDYNYNVHFWDEYEALGTGGGLCLLSDTIKETFIVTNCDILIMEDVREIVKHHIRENNKVTMVCSLKTFEIPYGVVNFTEGGEISSFEEKPQMSFFTNTGYYILEKDIFKYIKENEKIGMPDIIARMKDVGEKVGIYPIGEESWLDMGQFDTMESMERKLKEINIY